MWYIFFQGSGQLICLDKYKICVQLKKIWTRFVSTDGADMHAMFSKLQDLDTFSKYYVQNFFA